MAVEARATVLPSPNPAALPAVQARLSGNPLEAAKTVAEASPTASVLLAWTAVEQKLAEAMALAKGPSSSPTPMPPTIGATIDLLEKRGNYTEETISLLRSPRRLRNQVAHARGGGEHQIRESEARSYIALAADCGPIVPR